MSDMTELADSVCAENEAVVVAARALSAAQDAVVSQIAALVATQDELEAQHSAVQASLTNVAAICFAQLASMVNSENEQDLLEVILSIYARLIGMLPEEINRIRNQALSLLEMQPGAPVLLRGVSPVWFGSPLEAKPRLVWKQEDLGWRIVLDLRGRVFYFDVEAMADPSTSQRHTEVFVGSLDIESMLANLRRGGHHSKVTHVLENALADAGLDLRKFHLPSHPA